LNVDFFDSIRQQIPDVVIVHSRLPRLVVELRVMGEGVWSSLFSLHLSAHAFCSFSKIKAVIPTKRCVGIAPSRDPSRERHNGSRVSLRSPRMTIEMRAQRRKAASFRGRLRFGRNSRIEKSVRGYRYGVKKMFFICSSAEAALAACPDYEISGLSKITVFQRSEKKLHP
jgi:hypothetical protein